MYIRAKSNALSYLALFNGDILDVYDTYDEAVADLKSEIDYEIADGGVDNIDFGECWVETNDDAAEVVYIADGDEDYAQYVNASTNVRSKYVKAGSAGYWRDFKISGLRNVLRRFDSNGSSAKSGHWYIGNGGYDLDWELYYDNQPVIDCINGRLENVCLPSAVWNKISQVIISEYPDVTL